MVGHRNSIDRQLLCTVDHIRRLRAGSLENCRHDVGHVVKLLAQAADVLDAFRPAHDHAVASTAKMARVALGPLERRIKRPRPWHRHMVIVERAAQLVLDGVEVIETLGGAVADDANFIGGALQRAFGAAAIVALDEDDERVFGQAFLFDGIDHATDIVVVIGEIGRVDFRHMSIELFLLRVERVPGRHIGRTRRQYRVLRDHAELLLTRERFLAQLVPALSN